MIVPNYWKYIVFNYLGMYIFRVQIIIFFFYLGADEFFPIRLFGVWTRNMSIFIEHWTDLWVVVETTPGKRTLRGSRRAYLGNDTLLVTRGMPRSSRRVRPDLRPALFPYWHSDRRSCWFFCISFSMASIITRLTFEDMINQALYALDRGLPVLGLAHKALICLEGLFVASQTRALCRCPSWRPRDVTLKHEFKINWLHIILCLLLQAGKCT
jgi:hypothetical protein